MKYVIPTKEQEKTLYDVEDFPLEDSLKPVFNYSFIMQLFIAVI